MAFVELHQKCNDCGSRLRLPRPQTAQEAL
jgi:hypothetical protein